MSWNGILGPVGTSTEHLQVQMFPQDIENYMGKLWAKTRPGYLCYDLRSVGTMMRASWLGNRTKSNMGLSCIGPENGKVNGTWKGME